MRYAFGLARSRPRKLLTVVTKSNAQRHGMVMWDEIAAEVAAEFPDVTWDKMLVDAMTMRMSRSRETLDTIVATNLHADILSDLAAALAGSLGIAPTSQPRSRAHASLDVRADPRLGLRHHRQGIANPVGTFWTAAKMLEHLGETAAAARLMKRDRTGDRDPRCTRQISAATRPQGGDRGGVQSDPRRQRLNLTSLFRCRSTSSRSG